MAKLQQVFLSINIRHAYHIEYVFFFPFFLGNIEKSS